MTDMAFAFLLLLCSSKLILGELDVMGTEELKEVNDGVKMGEAFEADEAGELDMGELDNRVNVLDTLERVGGVETVEVGDLVDVKELKEIKEMKAVGKPREKRASFYKSGSEMAYQVLNKIKCPLTVPPARFLTPWTSCSCDAGTTSK